MRATSLRVVRVVALAIASLAAAAAASAQQAAIKLDDNCTISVLNRNVRVRADGSWVLPNVPANFGLVRARVTCVVNGQTISGESEPFVIPPNGVINHPKITFGQTTAIPRSLAVASSASLLTQAGATAQLTVIAGFADAATRDVTSGAGTQYTISNAAIATVSESGVVQAIKSGTVIVQATNEGASGMTAIRVAFAGADSDGDGIPDDYETAHGLNPNNPVDAQEDPDHDGLTNLQEYQLGTDPQKSDTDGDGLKDGDEVNVYRTNPLLWDSDGDGVSDGLEVGAGTDPLLASSVNLQTVMKSIRIAPPSFVLTYNTIQAQATLQLTVTGTMLDNRTIDLTGRGLNYVSSDLNICNFGGTPGTVFAGQTGSCDVTAQLGSFSATTHGTIRSFSPTALAFLNMPGFANSVAVSGNFVYVAAGSAGLQVVDVSNHASPQIAASLAIGGNANDVKLDGTRAYIAAGAPGQPGLFVVDISNPLAPRLLGEVNLPSDAYDVRALGNLAYVADGSSGLFLVDVSSPDKPLIVGSLAVGGTAKGVDVRGKLVAVAASFGGLVTVDVTNPSAPKRLGSVTLPDEAKDVALNANAAYVADFQGSLQVVDITDAAHPRAVGSTPQALGGILMDVATSPPFVFGADVFFRNGVPIVDATLPNNPVPRAILDFYAKFGRDDNGVSIAVDGSYIYMTAQRGLGTENGVSEDTRLYVGQYRALEDLNGVPPTVTLDEPADGSTFLEGETIPLTATATDDVAVGSVSFLVDGNVVFTDTAPPYHFSIKAPVGVPGLTVSAQAVDLGSNVGSSSDVHVNVIPDPLTTVVGRVVDGQGQPIPGVTVTVLGQSSFTAGDGTFSVARVPTLATALIVSAALTSSGTTIAGSSSAVPPVRGGTTDVGDIVASATSFENNLGARVAQFDTCPFCTTTWPLPFGFPVQGNIAHTLFINNGYVFFDTNDEFDVFCCDLSRGADANGGLFVNDQLPGKIVVTWNRVFTFDTGQALNTIQLILFDDGRVQFGYRGVSPDAFAEVGVWPAIETSGNQIDWSHTPDLAIPPHTFLYEDFSPFNNRFDLDGGFLVFAPSGDGGYNLHTVPDVVPPLCAITLPPNGAALFKGERLQVSVNATDNGGVTHVTLTSSAGNLNADLSTPPYTVDYDVPLDVSQVTFTATAFDGWRNSASCSSTVSVVSGPPPTLTITSPAAGATLTAGATIPITIDAPNRVPVASVDLLVDGVDLSTDATPPFSFLFTVPAGMTSLTLDAFAIDAAGKVGSAPSVAVNAIDDPLTTVAGAVVDRADALVTGAHVTTIVDGVTIETFDFAPPSDEWPPNLGGKTPNRISVKSAINLRNPEGAFGADPFGLGANPHVNRLTATLHTAGAGGTYTFTLGVNDRGQLKVNGAVVIDLPAGGGGFQQASADADVAAGAVSIEIVTVDNGVPEVQLLYGVKGGELKAAAAADLTPTLVPYQGVTDTSGAFAIAGVPTTLGNIGAAASFVDADGRTATGKAARVPPVAGGITDLGQIRAATGSILLLADVLGAGTDALVAALTRAGNTVTVTSPEYMWDGTNPPLANFNVVIHLNGATYATPLPQTAQRALVDFVNAGGGFIAAQWDGYERVQGRQLDMVDLVLQLWSSPGSQNCGGCNVTYTAVPEQAGHPLLKGIPSPFTFFSDGHDAGDQVPFGVNPSTVLMRVNAGGPGVLVRQLGAGRVVNFSFAANYGSTLTLQDVNVQQLYINSVSWVLGR